MNKIIIGLTGKKQSGKDSFADFLLQEFLTVGHPRKLGFADELYEDIATIFDSSSEFLRLNKQHPVIRHILQWYGTEFKRTGDPNYWIKLLDLKIKELPELKDPYIIIILDVRFLNEADWILKQKGILLRVVREYKKAGPHLHYEELDTHISETEMDKIPVTFTIHNYQTLLFLKNEARFYANFIKQKYGIKV